MRHAGRGVGVTCHWRRSEGIWLSDETIENPSVDERCISSHLGSVVRETTLALILAAALLLELVADASSLARG